MSKGMKLLLRVMGVIVALAFIAICLLVYFYNHVEYVAQPVKSDVIIMIDGGDTGRYTESAKLYKDKIADKVMISPAIEDPKGLNNVKAVEDAGVPAKAIIKEKGPTTSTWQNATHTIKLMKEKHLKSAVVVTSDYHTARTKLAYDRANKDNAVKITVVGVMDKDGRPWRETANGRAQARREAVVLPAYWLGLYKFIDL